MTYLDYVMRREFLISQREIILEEINNLEGLRDSYTREITSLQKRIDIEVFG